MVDSLKQSHWNGTLKQVQRDHAELHYIFKLSFRTDQREREKSK